MEIISWTKELETGHELIDHQHRILVTTINSLIRIYKIPAEESKDVIQNCLDRMVEYTVFHFETEESLMLSQNFKDLDFHKRIHDKFKNQIVNYYSRHSLGESVLESLITFLRGWLLNHIKVEDMYFVKELHK